MSYPVDLDEQPADALIGELQLRLDRRRRGRCDYCNRLPTDSPCRFPERHYMLRRDLAPPDTFIKTFTFTFKLDNVDEAG